MKKETSGARLRKIMAERGLRQVDVLEIAKPFCQQFGISLQKSALSQYINGKAEPGQDKLFLLGHVFDVNEAWLMGFDVPMEREPYLVEYNSDPGSPLCALFSRLSQMTLEKRDDIAKAFLSQLDNTGIGYKYLIPKKQELFDLIENMPDEKVEALLKLIGE